MAVSRIAKITRPILTEIFPRNRLFRLLDTGRKRPVTWIAGPPGCGKTTLVSSYLDARKLPCLWYQVDPADADPATFFYYLGLAAREAAPHKRKHLPPFLKETGGESARVSLSENERGLILQALEESNWNKHDAARRLQLSRSTLYSKIRRYGLGKRVATG